MTSVDRVAVVVPAHDEQELVGQCIASVRAAATETDVPVDILVVADACSDRTAEVASEAGARVLTGAWRNAGSARTAGINMVVADGIEDNSDWLWQASLWIATSDADSAVRSDWIARQLVHARAGADVVLGRVDVDDWSGHAPTVRRRFASHYAADPLPVHGASLGLGLRTWLRSGGFRAVPVGEDRDLVDRLLADPRVHVVSAADVRVTTSSRPLSRVEGGFASLLRSFADGACEAPSTGSSGPPLRSDPSSS